MFPLASTTFVYTIWQEVGVACLATDREQSEASCIVLFVYAIVTCMYCTFYRLSVCRENLGKEFTKVFGEIRTLVCTMHTKGASSGLYTTSVEYSVSYK